MLSIVLSLFVRLILVSVLFLLCMMVFVSLFLLLLMSISFVNLLPLLKSMKTNAIDLSAFRPNKVVKSHRIRKGDFNIYGYRIRDIGDCHRVHFAFSTPYCQYIIKNSPYWVKWIDSIRNSVFVVPAYIGAVGFEVTFAEFYHSFVSPCLI